MILPQPPTRPAPDTADRPGAGGRFEVDAILFDIDGTLVDSTPAVVRSWRAWCDAHDVALDELLSVSHGRRSEDTISMFLPVERVAGAVAFLDNLELTDFDDIIALPAAAALLASLPPDRWAVVTSGNRELMRRRLAAAGLPIPEVMVAAEDVRAGKPDPQGYLLAASRLGLEPGRCLVVEDAPAGIGAGLAAGSPVLGVATSHPAGEITAAHAVVDDLGHVRVSGTAGGLVVVVNDD